MKKVLFLLILVLLVSGCSGFYISPIKEGFKIMAYQIPEDFSHFEVYVGLAPGFQIPGWDEENRVWTGVPNEPREWDGTAKTLFTMNASKVIQVNTLVPGVRYYARVSAVDVTGHRSKPCAEMSVIAGGEAKGYILIAASDAPENDKAGADYICDGAGDQEEINAALKSTTDSGKKVVLSRGTFIVDGSIIIGDNDTLEGQGASTVIKIKDGLNTDIRVIHNINYSPGVATPFNKNITLRNFQLDGNKANNTATLQRGIAFFFTKNVNIDSVIVKDFLEVGIVVSDSDTVNITKCNVTSCGSIGIALQQLLGTAKNYTASSNICDNNGNSGIQLYQINGANIIGNTCNNNSFGIGGSYANNNSINGNVCNTNSQYGILLEYASQNAICNNNCLENGKIPFPARGAGIIIIDDSNSNNIQGNICRKGTSVTSLYGILIGTSDCDNNLLSNNDCYTGGVIAGISNAGTNTNFGAGNRNNDGTWSTTPN